MIVGLVEAFSPRVFFRSLFFPAAPFAKSAQRPHAARRQSSGPIRRGDELVQLSHETLSVDVSRPERDFDLTQHVVTDLTPRAPETRSA